MKVQVPEARLHPVLELYNPNFRYLSEASVDYPKASGMFRLENTTYTSKPVKHMTSIEVQFCLNQLSYVAFGEWLPEGRFNIQLPHERYLEFMKENMFIIDSHINFRKPIATDHLLIGDIELMKFRKFGNLYLAFLNYDIEGKSKGNMELALKI